MLEVLQFQCSSKHSISSGSTFFYTTVCFCHHFLSFSVLILIFMVSRVFTLSFAFTWWLGHFISRLFEGIPHAHVDEIHVWFITHALLIPVYRQKAGRPISRRNEWSFRVYKIPLGCDSLFGKTTVITSRRCDTRLKDILCWYHVNKYRASRRNRSELTSARKSTGVM